MAYHGFKLNKRQELIMKIKTLVIIVLSILLFFLFMGCGISGNPEFDFSNLPGPPPPIPPAEITWFVQPRAGISDRVIFTFSENPGNITANDISPVSGTLRSVSAVNEIAGNSL